LVASLIFFAGLPAPAGTAGTDQAAEMPRTVAAFSLENLLKKVFDTELRTTYTSRAFL
jgi:hypothetical protein